MINCYLIKVALHIGRSKNMRKTRFCKFFKVFIFSRNLNIYRNKLYIRNPLVTCFKIMYNLFTFWSESSHSSLKSFQPYKNSLNLTKSRNRNIFTILKWILFSIKFPFQRYIICWGKFCRSKIFGGGGAGSPSHLRLLFCKIVYTLKPPNLITLSFIRLFGRKDT